MRIVLRPAYHREERRPADRLSLHGLLGKFRLGPRRHGHEDALLRRNRPSPLDDAKVREGVSHGGLVGRAVSDPERAIRADRVVPPKLPRAVAVVAVSAAAEDVELVRGLGVADRRDAVLAVAAPAEVAASLGEEEARIGAAPLGLARVARRIALGRARHVAL